MFYLIESTATNHTQNIRLSNIQKYKIFSNSYKKRDEVISKIETKLWKNFKLTNFYSIKNVEKQIFFPSFILVLQTSEEILKIFSIFQHH